MYDILHSEGNLLWGENMSDAKSLWCEYEPYIRKFCAYRLSELPDSVDDCVQEVFLAFALALRKEKEIRYPKAWLTKTANNIALDMLKKEKIKAKQSISLCSIQDISVSLPEPEEAKLCEKQLLLAKDAFLASLSEEERTLFEARFVLKLSSKQLAKKLGISESAARKRVFRLRSKGKAFAQNYIKTAQNQNK